MQAAALEPRISATVVSGYYEGRHAPHLEPIYRNLFGVATLLDDAELSWLVAPRALIIEHAEVETVGPNPPPVRPGRRGGAAPGHICTPDVARVVAEVERANAGLAKRGEPNRVQLVRADSGGSSSGGGGGRGAVTQPGSTETIALFTAALVTTTGVESAPATFTDTLTQQPLPSSSSAATMDRMKRQVRELETCTAAAVQAGEQRRNAITWQPMNAHRSAAE